MLLLWQRHDVRPSLRIVLTMSPGLVRKQVSANICLCAPHSKQRVTSPVTRALPQVGKQGMEEYTYDLSRFEDFLSAKLAPVRHSFTRKRSYFGHFIAHFSFLDS